MTYIKTEIREQGIAEERVTEENSASEAISATVAKQNSIFFNFNNICYNDELQKAVPTVVHQGRTSATMNLPGDVNSLISHVSAVNVVVLQMGSDSVRPMTTGTVKEFDLDYYNLFVIGNEAFEKDHFLVPRDRALREGISEDLKAALGSLSTEAIQKIKKYPAIFASENHGYGKTDDAHRALYEIVTDIWVQENGVKVYYRKLNEIPQRRINELAFELGLGRASSFNELNRTHWTVKKINLVEALRDAGICVFAPV